MHGFKPERRQRPPTGARTCTTHITSRIVPTIAWGYMQTPPTPAPQRTGFLPPSTPPMHHPHPPSLTAHRPAAPSAAEAAHGRRRCRCFLCRPARSTRRPGAPAHTAGAPARLLHLQLLRHPPPLLPPLLLLLVLLLVWPLQLLRSLLLLYSLPLLRRPLLLLLPPAPHRPGRPAAAAQTPSPAIKWGRHSPRANAWSPAHTSPPNALNASKAAQATPS